MEVLQSNSDYIECELDPNEFRYDSDSDNDKSFVIIKEIPVYLWSLILCALTFLVTPVTNSAVYSSITTEGKKTRKIVMKQLRGLLQYGYQNEEKFVETAYFVTDQNESKEEGTLLSTAGYEKLGDERRTGGVFFV